MVIPGLVGVCWMCHVISVSIGWWRHLCPPLPPGVGHRHTGALALCRLMASPLQVGLLRAGALAVCRLIAPPLQVGLLRTGALAVCSLMASPLSATATASRPASSRCACCVCCWKRWQLQPAPLPAIIVIICRVWDNWCYLISHVQERSSSAILAVCK